MSKIKNCLQIHKITLIYGTSLALVLLLLKWLELRYIIFDHSLEVYIGSIALIFTALGIWLALKLSKPKTIIVEKEVYLQKRETFIPNEAMISQHELSPRELEILHLIASGKSNQEIANTIFVSLSTVKTHNQNIFQKLEVKRRTQAIEKAKRLQIIP